MPNHVHLILEPDEPLPAINRWLKTSTAIHANRLLRKTGGPFWQREYFDHWIRTEKELLASIRYVETNPVTAGLVARPESWPWSNAHHGK